MLEAYEIATHEINRALINYLCIDGRATYCTPK